MQLQLKNSLITKKTNSRTIAAPKITKRKIKFIVRHKSRNTHL